MIVSVIVAVAENGVIGKNNELPWHLPDDLRHFRALTKGKTVIMGRKTYESIGKPLPDRRNIVISTTKKSIPGCEVFSSLGDAFMRLHDEKEQGEVFIIGGVRIFQEAFMEILSEFSIHRIYLTRVHATVEGDVVFPDINWKRWKEISSEKHAKDAKHAHAFSLLVYEKKLD